MTRFRYCVNTRTCFGKYFDAKTDDLAKAYARGYADAKGWEHYKLVSVLEEVIFEV